MKLNIKKIFIWGSVILILILAFSFSAIAISSYKPKVAFYNVPEKTQNAIMAEINNLPLGKKGKSKKFQAINLQNDIPLSAQKINAKIIFSTLDYDVKDFALKNKKVKPANINLLNGMTSTVQEAAIKNQKKLFAVPLLYDFYQIDVNRSDFSNSSIKEISVWDDFENFLTETIPEKTAPFVFAGKDDTELLNTIGIFVEAFSGTEKLNSATEKIYNAFKKGNEDELSLLAINLCEEGNELYDAMKKISELIEKEIIPKSVLNFSKNDVVYYMSNFLSAGAAITLSEHRKFDLKMADNFSSIYFPSSGDDTFRTFSAPAIVAIPLKRGKTISSIVNLFSSSRQSALSVRSGLAPVQSMSDTPDKQADDVRFWIAASSGPNMPLAAALPSEESRKLFADILRNKLK